MKEEYFNCPKCGSPVCRRHHAINSLIQNKNNFCLYCGYKTYDDLQKIVSQLQMEWETGTILEHNNSKIENYRKINYCDKCGQEFNEYKFCITCGNKIVEPNIYSINVV